MTWRRLSFNVSAGLLLTASLSCDRVTQSFEQPDVLIQAQQTGRDYSTAGNLMATAIKETEQLDIVFYPRDLVRQSQGAVLSAKMEDDALARVTAMYPEDVQDQFKVGTMKGSAIKKFLLERSSESYRAEVDVAGLSYHIHFVGGYPEFANFSRPEHQRFVDDEYYRVAISNFFYFSGQTFPGYKYRNGLNMAFRDLGRMISARDSLRTYLSKNRVWPDLKERRALVTRARLGDNGFLPIAQIQGPGHRSPYYGQRVTTRGIVTAAGSVQWYPGGAEVVIQSQMPDDDPRTSEALLLYFENDGFLPKLGDLLEVTGVVYEQITGTGLGMTSLREIESYRVLQSGLPLPEPIRLGAGGRPLPLDRMSSWRGDLNLKPTLDLSDGIDFWESLEGMRVQIDSPRVVGFRGGQSAFQDTKPKTYLTLYVRPDGTTPDPQESKIGGLIVNFPKKDFNPNIVQIATNHLTAPVDGERIFNNGDLISGPVVGVLVYQKNLFGDGEFNLVLPTLPDSVKRAFEQAPQAAIELKDRPRTSITAKPDQLSVVTFNVENLGGDQIRRLQKLGEALEINLHCPDLINFAEIQDANGPSFIGDADATKTLQRIIQYTHCPQQNYQFININPVENGEGGQPGGNIRVAQIYNANKLNFVPKGNPTSLKDTLITPDGHISQNPGRVFPMAPTFQGVRRSLVVEYSFRGQQLFLIGNHLNSKLGDTSVWESIQPPYFHSEDHRIVLADNIRRFTEYLTNAAPASNVAVLGDFNALETELSMQTLMSSGLRNLMLEPNQIPANDRYSINFDGNSQCIDHIFANANLVNRLVKIEIVHFNSDYMGRISDHDPVSALFQF